MTVDSESRCEYEIVRYNLCFAWKNLDCNENIVYAFKENKEVKRIKLHFSWWRILKQVDVSKHSAF